MNLPETTKETTETFAEPWQAQAFALAVHLIERGVFSRAEWSEALGEQRRIGGDGGAEYYHDWLAALETLLIRKGLAESSALTDLKQAWIAAYERTPHGKPVRLTEGNSQTS